MEATGSAPASSQSSGGLRGLIAQKERELHDINEYRLHTLESLVAEREREAGVAKESLAKLKEDFAYNLRLLEERDAELERCAAMRKSAWVPPVQLDWAALPSLGSTAAVRLAAQIGCLARGVAPPCGHSQSTAHATSSRKPLARDVGLERCDAKATTTATHP